MTLKVYLSGSSKELGRAFHWEHELRSCEHITITSTWLTRDPARWAGCDVDRTRDERLCIVREELAEIRSSDVLWLLMPSVPSFGAACEFMAAALHTGVRLVVSGPLAESSIFTALANDDLYNDDSNAFGVISGWAASMASDARRYVP